MSLRSFFAQSSYDTFNVPGVGKYHGIIEKDAVARAFLIAQQQECSKQPNCISNAIMGFPAEDDFIKKAMEDVVRRKYSTICRSSESCFNEQLKNAVIADPVQHQHKYF